LLWGFDGVEFRNKRAGIDETAGEYLDSIYKAAKKHGLKKVLFGGGKPNVADSDRQTFDSEMDYCMDFYPRAYEMFEFEVCNLLLGTVMNPSSSIPYKDYTRHGSYIARKEHWDNVEKALKMLAGIADEKGFRFAMETHPNYLHDTVGSTMKLAQASGSENIGVNLDYINAAAYPDEISIGEAIEKSGERLFYVHLKNVIKLENGMRIRTGLGDGECNNRHILKSLKEAGYEGPICIEAPREGDREWFARQDLAYMKMIMKEIG
jgi:sugar phosphate isomerase/epimerase